MTTATVPVKSAWYSKINWTAFASAAVAVVVALGFAVPDNEKANILTLVACVQSLAIWIFRTWFNGTVPPSSV